jgi:hypothetical protein
MNAEQIRDTAARDRTRVWVLAAALAATAACVVVLQDRGSDGFLLGGLLAVGVTLVAWCTLITRGINEEVEAELASLRAATETADMRSDEGQDSTLFYELMDAEPGEALDAFDLAVLLQRELRDPNIGEADVTRWVHLGYRVSPREVIRLRALVTGRHVHALHVDALAFADTVLRAEAWTRPHSGR